MGEYEQRARKLHKEGNNCSTSLHRAISEDIELSKEYPAPRSIEGKCGALLTAKKILKEKGYEDKIEKFEEEFLKRFGYVKCMELMTHERRCNDYVGETAKILEEILKGGAML